MSNEQYLRTLRRALAPLPQAERAEIVAEIESHLAETGDAASLGPAEVLAQAYLDDRQLATALGRPAPGLLLATMLARATRSGTAFVAGLSGVILYAFAASLLLIAIAKPVAPAHVGYWSVDGQTLFGLAASPPPLGHERLGLWIVPIALVGAVACYLLATGLMRVAGRRLLRRDAPGPR